VRVVQRALDLGITLVDTARVYGTESAVGRGIAGRRDDVVLSTKVWPERDGQLISARDLRESVEKSLRRLQTDRIDIFFLHGVGVRHLVHAREVLVPEMRALRDEGALRFLAASEAFGSDPGHAALAQLLDEDDWADVLMVGFNLLNPSARDRVFAASQAKDIGILVMFAVRRALSDPGALRDVVRSLVDAGQIDPDAIDVDDPLGFLVDGPGAAESVVDAAYRFTRHEPGCHVVLTGTGSVEHLEQNVASIDGPPLRDEDRSRLHALFGAIDTVSAN
jgi:aryl-alcohol dehydrogenase-like predicted oxidoreductase